MYHHYLQWRIQQYTKNFDEMMSEIVDHCEDNTVEISKVVQLKKKMLMYWMQVLTLMIKKIRLMKN